MDTMFMNSESDRTADYHVLTLKLTDKLDLRKGKKPVALSNHGLQHGVKDLSYQMGHIQYQIFKIILNIF